MTQEQRGQLAGLMDDWSAADRAEGAFGIIAGLGYAAGAEREQVHGAIDRVAPECAQLMGLLIDAEASTTLGVIGSILYFIETLRVVLLMDGEE